MKPGTRTRLSWSALIAAALVVVALRAGAADTTRPAGDAGATRPTGGASTAPTTRYVAEIPKGFHVIAANDREAICMPVDDEWVRIALRSAPAATRPSTTPTDIVHRLASIHDQLADQMTADLGLADHKMAADYLDTKLQPTLQRIANLRPRILYMVATTAQVVDMLKSGTWHDPHFQLDHLTDRVMVDQRMTLDPSGRMDDFILPCIVDDAKATTQEKQTGIETAIQKTETQMQGAIANGAPAVVFDSFKEFIALNGILPLRLRMDEQWFNFGVTQVFACDYLSQLIGVPFEDLVVDETRQLPGDPFVVAEVDALHPMALQDVQPQYQYAYIDALSRKSTEAAYILVKTGHRDVITKIIVQMRAAAPTSGPSTQPSSGDGLLDEITTMSGQDLHRALSR